MAAKALPIIVSAVILGLVLFYIEPPQSFNESSIFKFVLFFIPFFTLITFSTNLYFRFLPKSILIALTVVVILICKLLNFLNSITILIILSITLLLIIFIKKSKNRQSDINNLFYKGKIPKLSNISKHK